MPAHSWSTTSTGRAPPGQASTRDRHRRPAQSPTGIASQERDHSSAPRSILSADLGELPAQPYSLRISARSYPGPAVAHPCRSKTEKHHHNGGIFGRIDAAANLCQSRSACEHKEPDCYQKEKRSAVSAHFLLQEERR